VTHLELSIKTLSDEIVKANEIIRKLQHDSKSVHSKVCIDYCHAVLQLIERSTRRKHVETNKKVSVKIVIITLVILKVKIAILTISFDHYYGNLFL